MSYLAELHAAHRERQTRLGMTAPPPQKPSSKQPLPVETTAETSTPPPPPHFNCLSVHNVMRVVAQNYGVTVNDLKSHDRHLHIVRPRQITMTIAHELCPHRSYPQLGRDFGFRDHTTIMHAVRVTTAGMADNPELAEEIQKVKQAVIASCTSK